MGNQQDKIIFLDPSKTAKNQNKDKLIGQRFQISTYTTFKQLVEKENMKELSKIIVRVHNKEQDIISRKGQLNDRSLSRMMEEEDQINICKSNRCKEEEEEEEEEQEDNIENEGKNSSPENNFLLKNTQQTKKELQKQLNESKNEKSPFLPLFRASSQSQQIHDHVNEQYSSKNDLMKSSKKSQHNYFSKVCSIGRTQKKNAFEELIAYKKNYSLNISVFLLVDDITNILILQTEKPYVDMISDNIEQIIIEIRSQKKVKFKKDIKFDRMANNMYRRIMVKIVHPDAGVIKQAKLGKLGNLRKDSTTQRVQRNDDSIRQLSQIEQMILEQSKKMKKNHISFDYYKNIKDFQASSISTSCEFVICRPDYLDEVLDSKKLNGTDYQIIIKPDPGQEDFKANSSNSKFVWIRQSNIDRIIKIMKRCSNLASQQKPQNAQNTIVCGDSFMFQKNIQKIEKKVRQHLTKINPNDEKYVQKLSMRFVSGDRYDKIIECLKKHVYSLVIVFDEGTFLQKLKAKLRASNWSHRVQLTSLQNYKGQENTFEDYMKWKLKRLQKVKYKIRFQIAPIPSIHYYIHDSSTRYYRNQIQLVKNRLGIQIFIFQKSEIENYQPPSYDEFFESGYIICCIEHLTNIKNSLFKFKECYLSKLKIVIFDDKENIKEFVKHQENYTVYGKYIVFMHYHISRITQFLSTARSPVVSLPFFKKGALSGFQQTSNKLETIKPSLFILNTELVSTNEVLKGIFKEEFQISMSYYLDLLVFTNSHRNVKFFEQRYLDSYANLWSVGYSLFGETIIKGVKNIKMNVSALKEDIKYCFKTCKTYDLLKVTDQDFPTFYISKIDSCNSFHDLQITCLYILSLPHGLNQTLSQLFRNSKKSKLAIKIFCALVFVLLTTFCKFEDEQLGFLRLITYIKQKEDVKRLKILKPGDIVFTGSFQFCCENQQSQIEDRKDCIIYEFQKMHFLDKTRVKNYLQIEDISFYKEGTQYLIPPFAKFRVKQNKINRFGMRHLILQQCKDFVDVQKSSFTKMVLNSNNIHQKDLAKILEDEILYVETGKGELKKLQMEKQKQKSLYKQNQIVNFEQSKMKHLQNLQQGILYNKYFEEFQKKHYVSAYEALAQKIQSLNKEAKNQMSALKNEEAMNILNIQFALLHYKMSEYSSAIIYLRKAQSYLSSQKLDTSDKWALHKVSSFIKEIQQVIHHRRNFIKQVPKKKKWIVRPFQEKQDEEITFTVKGARKMWTANYDASIQQYSIGPKPDQQSQPKEYYFALQPIHQLGSPVLNWHQKYLYGVSNPNRNLSNYEFLNGNFNLMEKIKQLASPQKRSLRQIEQKSGRNNANNGDRRQKKESLKKQDRIVEKVKKQKSAEKFDNFNDNPYENEDGFQGEILSGLIQKKQWQIFYLGNQVKVMSKKKKHYHKKLKKLQ